MPVATGIALLAAGLLGAGGSVASSLIGKSAAQKAADQQVQEQNQALDLQKQSLDFQKQTYANTQANQQPFVSAGQTSIGKLIEGFQNGTFASLPEFKAPTEEEARATPGYEFTRDQGTLGINRGQAAAGGAFTGGTLKSLAGFTTGLADSTYNDSFARAMAAYNAHATAQQQSFNQLASVAGLGENAAANAGNNGIQAGSNIANGTATIGNTLTNIGSAQAAGTIGRASAINQGIGSTINSLTTPLYLQQYYNNNQAQQNYTPTGWNGTGTNATPPGQPYVTPYAPPIQQYIPPGAIPG